MDTRVSLQPAYVLHTRPFQNTSLIVDFFTIDYGRVTAVAKGARRQGSKYRSHLQPFHPLLLSFSGRGEMKTVTKLEASLAAIRLQGERLFSGLYLNELLSRLLQNHEEYAGLYRHYQQTLIALQGESEMEPLLRRFELNLLGELGYAVDLERDVRSQEAIVEDALYHFLPDVGFERLTNSSGNDNSVFEGAHLIALRENALVNVEAAAAAKRLLRLALGAHLGEKPLNSRLLFGRTRTTLAAKQ